MMRLLIDAGNSFVKWAYHDGAQWQSPGRAERTTWCRDPRAFLAIEPQRIAIANVAGPEVMAALSEVFPAVAVNDIRAQAQAGGVRNSYQTPASLGSDRWAALIAARSITQSACVVISSGTALTADALDDQGCFLGGIIVPGRSLMRQALCGATHALTAETGNLADFPHNTADAITSGLSYALAGAIEAMARHLEQHTGAAVHYLVTGGDAAQLAPQLNRPTQVVDNLVLQGVLLIAQSEDSP